MSVAASLCSWLPIVSSQTNAPSPSLIEGTNSHTRSTSPPDPLCGEWCLDRRTPQAPSLLVKEIPTHSAYTGRLLSANTLSVRQSPTPAAYDGRAFDLRKCLLCTLPSSGVADRLPMFATFAFWPCIDSRHQVLLLPERKQQMLTILQQ
jgi:hypothetical protein